MCRETITFYACGHTKLSGSDRCAAAVYEQGSSPSAFRQTFSCANYGVRHLRAGVACGIGRVYCGVTAAGKEVDQAYNKRTIICKDIANMNGQINVFSEDLQWRGLQLRIAAEAHTGGCKANSFAISSVGRDAEFLHTKAVGLPFVQERSTLIEQYWTLTTFIESCETHWLQVLNQRKAMMQMRQQEQQAAAASQMAKMVRMNTIERQQGLLSGALMNATEATRRKDSGIGPENDTIKGSTGLSPTAIQKLDRPKRRAEAIPEASHHVQRKRKTFDRSYPSHHDAFNGQVANIDAESPPEVRRSARTIDKKVDYSQISSTQSDSRESTPSRNSDSDSAFSQSQSVASNASTAVPPGYMQATKPSIANNARRGISHNDPTAPSGAPLVVKLKLPSQVLAKDSLGLVMSQQEAEPQGALAVFDSTTTIDFNPSLFAAPVPQDMVVTPGPQTPTPVNNAELPIFDTGFPLNQPMYYDSNALDDEGLHFHAAELATPDFDDNKNDNVYTNDGSDGQQYVSTDQQIAKDAQNSFYLGTHFFPPAMSRSSPTGAFSPGPIQYDTFQPSSFVQDSVGEGGGLTGESDHSSPLSEINWALLDQGE
jgi:hypothetical protein